MAPEFFNSMDAAELREIAQWIREWQLVKKISDAALCKKFIGLGSTKTFKRILDNDLDELDLEKQLTNYRTVRALIESLGDDEGKKEELYSDLTPAVHFSRVLLETMRESGIARFILMIGDTGTGKTMSLRVMREKYGQRLFAIEANVAWKDSPMAMLGAILVDAFGVKDPPYNTIERLNKVIERLKASRVCLLIDEGHHIGPNCLNLIKTLINQTPGEFVVAAKETLWKKLEREAYDEAKQLTRNRLAEKITLAGADRADVKKLLERRINWENGDSKTGVKLIMDRASAHGHLAFAREVINRVNEMAEKEPVSIELFTAAVTAEEKSR
jgi:type II secretory pathway predicted ATPase ExeA